MLHLAVEFHEQPNHMITCKKNERKAEETASFLFERERIKLQRSFSAMIKVVGPVCNLDCDYCYYLEKDALYPGTPFTVAAFGMREEMLEKVIRDYILSQPQEHIEFIWHGGEPTLLGLDYFRKILSLQKKYGDGKVISNSLQTNGTLINDEWAAFLAANHFLCGLSIDGPEHLHNRHRCHPNGKGSWAEVVACARLFRKHGVEFNTMSVVNASNSKEPVAVYDFLKELGSRFMQFTPIVERISLDENAVLSIVDNRYAKETALMQENVSAEAWGNFLCRIFDRWIKSDVGYCYINWFDNTLAAYMGEQPALCSMRTYCPCSLAIEHNGDVYSCDHFVFPDYRLGNLTDESLTEMVKSDRQLYFEQYKQDSLSSRCRGCDYLFACGGDCPKNRIQITPEGDSISTLCGGFKMFFEHTRRYFEYMANELKNNRPPANVMKVKLG